MMDANFHTGFVAVLGPTNAGKSTLFNSMMKKKLSIVSRKSQTTYHAIRGIKHGEESQTVLIDTPGLQRYPQRIPRLLNEIAKNQAKDADLLVWVFDVSCSHFRRSLDQLLPLIQKSKPKANTILVLNKVDCISKPLLLPILDELIKLDFADEIIPVSALKGSNVDRLEEVLQAKLPKGEPHYPKDMSTDRSFAFQVTEIIREKIYAFLHQEVPYAVWVELEQIDPAHSPVQPKTPTHFVRIHVDSESKKAMLIGKGGTMLKRIGVAAREDLEKVIGHQICLKLHVDVQPSWQEDKRKLLNYLELES